MSLEGENAFKKTSELTDAEKNWVSGFVSGQPWFDFYWQCGLDDLARGLDNRSYLLGRRRDGLIMALHFDEVSAFTSVGAVCLADMEALAAWPGRAELHLTDTQMETVKGLCAGRVRRTDTIRYYSLALAGRKRVRGRAVEVAERQRDEVKEFFRRFYPETVLSDWTLKQPTAGLWLDGTLVAVAGTLALSERLQGAHIGNFLTHPDHRGKGLAAEVAERQFATLERRGIETCMLGVFGGNTGACRAYERMGFSLVEERPLIYINPK